MVYKLTLLLSVAIFPMILRAESEECFRGFVYAELGEVEKFEQFLKQNESNQSFCLTKFKYKGERLPNYVIKNNYYSVFPTLIQFTGPNWRPLYSPDTASLLEEAFRIQNDNFVNYLIENGAELNTRFALYFKNQTPLQVAVEEKSSEDLAIKLLEYGASPAEKFVSNGNKKINYTMASAVMHRGFVNTLEHLLQKKHIDPNAEVNQILKSGKVHINLINLMAFTSFPWMPNRIKALETLLSYKADINKCTEAVVTSISKPKQILCPIQFIEFDKLTHDLENQEWLRMTSKYELDWNKLNGLNEEGYSSIEIIILKALQVDNIEFLENIGVDLIASLDKISNIENFTKVLKIIRPDIRRHLLTSYNWAKVISQSTLQSKEFTEIVFKTFTDKLFDRPYMSGVHKYFETVGNLNFLNIEKLFHNFISSKDLEQSDLDNLSKYGVEIERLASVSLKNALKEEDFNFQKLENLLKNLTNFNLIQSYFPVGEVKAVLERAFAELKDTRMSEVNEDVKIISSIIQSIVIIQNGNMPSDLQLFSFENGPLVVLSLILVDLKVCEKDVPSHHYPDGYLYRSCLAELYNKKEEFFASTIVKIELIRHFSFVREGFVNFLKRVNLEQAESLLYVAENLGAFDNFFGSNSKYVKSEFAEVEKLESITFFSIFLYTHVDREAFFNYSNREKPKKYYAYSPWPYVFEYVRSAKGCVSALKSGETEDIQLKCYDEIENLIY